MKIRFFRSSFGWPLRWGMEITYRKWVLHIVPLSWQRWQRYQFEVPDARLHDISGWCIRLGPFSLECEPVRLWRVKKAWEAVLK